MELIAACVILGALSAIAVAAPLLRRPPATESRAAREVEALKAHLSELESDRARGALADSEAEAARIEIARRLLKADAAAQAEPVHKAAPPWASAALGVVMIAAGGVGAWMLYVGGSDALGRPDLPDLPFAARDLDADVPAPPRQSQEEAERLAIERGAVPETAPEPDPATAAAIADYRMRLASPRGRLLVRLELTATLLAAGDHRGAIEQLDVIIPQVDGDASTADGPRPPATFRAELRLTRAESLFRLTGGYISPRAEADLDAALELTPSDMRARYLKGLAMAQSNRPREALAMWRAMLIQGDPTAGWRADVRDAIVRLATSEGLDPLAILPDAPDPDAAPAAPGPTAEQVRAAEQMSPEERAAMIASMIEGLDARLSEQGGSPQEWARLTQARMRTEGRDAGMAAADRARAALADDPDALTAFERMAARMGLAGQ